MNFKEVKELIELINSSQLAYFEIETDDGYIKMDKSLSRNIVSEEKDKEVVTKELPSSQGDMNNSISVNVATDGSEIKVEEKDEDLKVIKSPMVGTFYSASSPDSKAFVSEGKGVSKGDVLCIVEAMKLMNEIESDVNGVVREILVRDGEMVEYGQPLFKVKEI
ncbi:acetyl-CoA carboxylase biotin carboxyl carrier protein [Clostridium paraputrificum]|uniref:acetyl-CoA carboxylase biotin carboxyl carrier protein n=1 Tax=Clostridium TaxID=1485 RepID=UPI000EA0FAF7|nr:MULTISPECIES: acetyl-CoA carboxylase biotin carboxyl carrier protein [Clostridium]MDB2110725.1 acetyl-CoA carboxylase biotin carboxyl carrier protein [Clostridium paraputrificum]MDU4144696.1 acetyl-CoA carboxylase biotin carboxyl carrier protein [Clostridium sp.]RKI49263.1 acetyl-CoA carboxylase biotin carboxyl carrier protein [Clostridium paraputrificum]